MNSRERSQFYKLIFYSFLIHALFFIGSALFSFLNKTTEVTPVQITWVRLGTPEGSPDRPPATPVTTPSKKENSSTTQTPAQKKEEPQKIAEKKETAKLPPVKAHEQKKEKTDSPAQKKKETASVPQKNGLKTAPPAPVKTEKAEKKLPVQNEKKSESKKTTDHSTPTTPKNNSPKTASSSDSTSNHSAKNQTAKTTSKEDSKIQDALSKLGNIPDSTAGAEGNMKKAPGLGSPGGDPKGSNNECSVYSSRIRQKIIQNWTKAVGKNSAPRPPKLSVRITASGSLLASPQWVQKSGDFSLDSSTLRAIQNASPFPPPPSGCAEALEDGFVIVFRN